MNSIAVIDRISYGQDGKPRACNPFPIWKPNQLKGVFQSGLQKSFSKYLVRWIFSNYGVNIFRNRVNHLI